MTNHRKKESVNGYFRSARGRLDLRLGLVGREDDLSENAEAGSSSAMVPRGSSKDRIKVIAISYERMKVEVVSSKQSESPFSVALVLPRLPFPFLFASPFVRI